MKSLVRAAVRILPPFITERFSPYGFTGRYNSYESAKKAARGSDYASAELCKTVALRTLRYRDEIRASGESSVTIGYHEAFLLLGLMKSVSSRKVELKVLDFGGGCGAHFFCAQKLLPQTFLKWHIIETPEMVEASTLLVENGLTFSSSLEDLRLQAPDFDVLVSSSSLQYTPNPLGVLSDLLSLGVYRVILVRNGIGDSGRDIISVQRSPLASNGPGQPLSEEGRRVVRYPVTFVTRRAFESCLTEKYDLQIKLKEPVSYALGTTRIPSFGYMATRTENQHHQVGLPR